MLTGDQWSTFRTALEREGATALNLETLIEQYRGTTLAKLIERQIRSMSEDQLLAAIQGTYMNFPLAFRPKADSFSLEYGQRHWFGPPMVSADLGELFATAIRDSKKFAFQHGTVLTDEQASDLFHIAVMRIAHFAHSRSAFRKQIGIKKGWFS